MNPNIKILFFLILFNPIFYCGQANSDSLKSIWNNKSNSEQKRIKALDQYLNIETANANEGIGKAVFLFEKMVNNSKDLKLIAQSYYYKGILYRDQGKFDSSLKCFQKKIDISISIFDTLGQANGYNGIATCYNGKGQFQKANNFYFKSLDLLSKYSDKAAQQILLADVNNNIGTILLQLSQYDKAIVYFKSCISSDKYTQFWNGITAGYVNIGCAYIKKHELDSALIYLDSAIVLSEKKNVNQTFKANTFVNIGSVYVLKSDTISGIEMLEKAMEIFKSSQNDYDLSKVLLDLALIKKDTISINLCFEALEIAKKIDAKFIQKDIYDLLYVRYKQTGNNVKALKMLENSIEVKEVLNPSNALLEFSEYEKGQELNLLSKKNKNQIMSMKSKYTDQFYLFLIIAFFVIILIVIFSFYRFKKQKSEKFKLIEEINQYKKSKAPDDKINLLEPIDKQILSKIIQPNINESDWNILITISNNNSLNNKQIAEKVNLSVDGVKSSLKKMYRIFEVPKSQNMRISLILIVLNIIKEHKN